jgi:hypothetical protein
MYYRPPMLFLFLCLTVLSHPSLGMFHWSKDFVEHLRKIHFALITLSTGLIILVLSSQPYNPKVASEEVREILKLQRVGSPAWLRSQPARFVPADQDLAPRLTHTLPDHYIALRDESYHPKTIRGTIHTSQKTMDVMFVFPDDDWFQTTWSSYRAGSPQEFPGTLPEFQEWWDSLLHPEEHYIDVNFALNVKDEGTIAGLPESSNYVLLHDAPDTDSALKHVNLRKHLDSQKSGFVGRLPKSNQEVFFYTGLYNHVEASQALLQGFFPSLCRGSFAESFSDLAKATAGLGPLTLEETRKLVSDEAAKGSDRFEAFGMKFPVDQVTRWGAILLLSVQIYLFAYLRQLTGKLSSTDPAWEAPWIGMDQSLLSRVIVFATVVLLPCIAVALLGSLAVQQVLRAGTPHDICNVALSWKGLTIGSYLQMLGFVVAALCAGYLGALCWKRRPTISEQPNNRAGSQQFE